MENSIPLNISTKGVTTLYRNTNNDGFVLSYYTKTTTAITMNFLEVLATTNITQRFKSYSVAKIVTPVSNFAVFNYYDSSDFSGIQVGSFSNGSYTAYAECTDNTYTRIYPNVIN